MMMAAAAAPPLRGVAPVPVVFPRHTRRLTVVVILLVLGGLGCFYYLDFVSTNLLFWRSSPSSQSLKKENASEITPKAATTQTPSPPPPPSSPSASSNQHIGGRDDEDEDDDEDSGDEARITRSSPPSSSPTTTTTTTPLVFSLKDVQQKFPECFSNNSNNSSNNNNNNKFQSVVSFLDHLGKQKQKQGQAARYVLKNKRSKKNDENNSTSRTKHQQDEASLSYGIPYDHQSCFMMKARYNCAISNNNNNNNTSRLDDVASNYKLVWGQQQEQECDLYKVIDWIGGPAGVGRVLVAEKAERNRKKRISSTSTSTSTSEKYHQVFIQGDSRLRQVTEALICRFQEQITNLILCKDPPPMSMAAVENLKHQRNKTTEAGILTTDDIAKPLHALVRVQGEDNNALSNFTATASSSTSTTTTMRIDLEELKRQGCHGASPASMPGYYRPNVTVPATMEGCTDDLVMVEFGHTIRFYYVFRPHFYNDEAIMAVYHRLGVSTTNATTAAAAAPAAPARTLLENSSNHNSETLFFLDGIDDLMWNSAGKEIRHLSPGNQDSLRKLSWEGVVPKLYEIQRRSIGRYFGADNPWITNPPDQSHPCMPGIPDDEVNLLLFALLGGMS